MDKKVKIAAVAWGLPGGGYFAPQIAGLAGLDGIQLELGSYDWGYPLSQKEIRCLYMEAGAALGIEYPSIVLNDVMVHEFIHGNKSENWKIAMEQVDLGLYAADDMGIKQLMIPNFENNLITANEHEEHTAEFLEAACDKAGNYGITILTETALDYNRQIQLMNRVGKDNLKLFFDSQNYKFFSGLDQTEQLENLLPVMTNQIHLKDGIVKPGGKLLGEGSMQFAEQSEILKREGFEGWLILENYYNQMRTAKDNRTDQMALLKLDIETVKKQFYI